LQAQDQDPRTTTVCIQQVEERVEDRLEAVGERQVHEEVVCDAAHAPMSEDNPHDNRVAADRHRHHRDERRGLQEQGVPPQHDQYLANNLLTRGIGRGHFVRELFVRANILEAPLKRFYKWTYLLMITVTDALA